MSRSQQTQDSSEGMLLCHRDGLNSLVALGFHCQALQDYVESATLLLPGQQKSSLICRAVATGLSGVNSAHHNFHNLCSQHSGHHPCGSLA